MDAVALMGKIVKDCAYRTKDSDSLACAKLVVFANAVEDNPFRRAHSWAREKTIPWSMWAFPVPES